MNWKGFGLTCSVGRAANPFMLPALSEQCCHLIALEGRRPARLCQIFSHVRLGCALTMPPVSPAQGGRKIYSCLHPQDNLLAHPVPDLRGCWAPHKKVLSSLTFPLFLFFITLQVWWVLAGEFRWQEAKPGHENAGLWHPGPGWACARPW